MAKDPAFLFYDGDAARDVSHMNRLERGCYFDFLQAQRKFGRMDIIVIKKILGKDFESCWEALKLILTCVEDMYFIEWLEEASIKRKAYSESRKKNRIGQKSPNSKDMKNISLSCVKDMENENENENTNVNVDKGVQGEKVESFLIEYEKPKLEKVKRAFSESGYPEEDAESFWSHYSSLGWEMNGKPIKYWGSLILKWMNNTKQFNRSGNGKNNSESKGSVKSRTDYKYDAEKSEQRLKDLKKQFGD